MRVQQTEHLSDQNGANAKQRRTPLTGDPKRISGCLIRSDIVAGWPDLQIEGSASSIVGDKPMNEAQKLRILRRDRLSEDIFICLFDGVIRTVDIFLKPEGLHFGFNHDATETLWRELRTRDGIEKSDWRVHLTRAKDTEFPMINQKNVINITNLSNSIQTKLQEQEQSVHDFTAAQFALQMIQGIEKVRFSITISSLS